MTCYVDRYIGPFDTGKWRGGGHLFGTDLAELHEVARRIGLRRDWFQHQTVPHYDLTAGKRTAALGAGAVAIEPGQFPDDLVVRCRDGSYERYADRRARLSGGRSTTTAGDNTC